MWLAVVTLMSQAATVWNGPIISYAQPGTDPTQAVNQDRVTSKVWLTRAGTMGLFNVFKEAAYTHSLSPNDTEWAYGTLANYQSLSYTNWEAWHGNSPALSVGRPAVLHLISEDIYLSIEFTFWAVRGGGFSYHRSTAGVELPPPIVTLITPTNGTVFSSPASLTLIAEASVSTGSVTNVTFFANATPLGSVQTTPFKVTVINLAPGAYTLTAVATAAGISTTSAGVNITVTTPVGITLTTPTVTSGQFSFDYSANPGLTYLVEASSDLMNWLPVLTNVASSNPAHFSEPFVPIGSRSYRVRRLPNP